MALEEVFENERGTGFGDKSKFNAGALFKSERGPWSTASGQPKLPMDCLEVPNKQWKWVNAWRVDNSTDVDEDGWEYAMNWGREFSSVYRKTSFVRRRKWIRLRQKITAETEEETEGMREMAAHLEDAQQESGDVTSVRFFFLFLLGEAELNPYPVRGSSRVSFNGFQIRC